MLIFNAHITGNLINLYPDANAQDFPVALT